MGKSGGQMELGIQYIWYSRSEKKKKKPSQKKNQDCISERRVSGAREIEKKVPHFAPAVSPPRPPLLRKRYLRRRQAKPEKRGERGEKFIFEQN